MLQIIIMNINVFILVELRIETSIIARALQLKSYFEKCYKVFKFFVIYRTITRIFCTTLYKLLIEL